jgi:hypothetical protein
VDNDEFHKDLSGRAKEFVVVLLNLSDSLPDIQKGLLIRNPILKWN